MNAVIRIVQVLVALFVLNSIYGLALQLFLSPLASDQKSSMWNIIGSLVTSVILGFIVFLLQRYYEIRNKTQTSTTPKKFLGTALTGASIVTLIGAGIVILVFLSAWLNL